MRTDKFSVKICNAELNYKGEVRFIGQFRDDGRLYCICLPRTGEIIVDDLTMNMLQNDFGGDIPRKILDSIVNYYISLLPKRELRFLFGDS